MLFVSTLVVLPDLVEQGPTLQCASCRYAVDEAEVQFNAVRLKLAEADAARADLAGSFATAKQDARDAVESQQAAEAALSEARESLDERSSASSESAATLRAKEHRITQLQRQLTSQVSNSESLAWIHG